MVNLKPETPPPQGTYPFDPITKEWNKTQYTLRLDEGQACHCDADITGGPAGGQAIYVSRQADSDDHKNWLVEVHKLSSNETREDFHMPGIKVRGLTSCPE